MINEEYNSDGIMSKVYYLIDFGMATFQHEFNNYSYPGTLNYFSPKLVNKYNNNKLQIDAINYKDDCWSLGNFSFILQVKLS